MPSGRGHSGKRDLGHGLMGARAHGHGGFPVARAEHEHTGIPRDHGALGQGRASGPREPHGLGRRLARGHTGTTARTHGTLAAHGGGTGKAGFLKSNKNQSGFGAWFFPPPICFFLRQAFTTAESEQKKTSLGTGTRATQGPTWHLGTMAHGHGQGPTGHGRMDPSPWACTGTDLLSPMLLRIRLYGTGQQSFRTRLAFFRHGKLALLQWNVWACGQPWDRVRFPHTNWKHALKQYPGVKGKVKWTIIPGKMDGKMDHYTRKAPSHLCLRVRGGRVWSPYSAFSLNLRYLKEQWRQRSLNGDLLTIEDCTHTWSLHASTIRGTQLGLCPFGCGSCGGSSDHIMECIARPALQHLRRELSVVLLKGGVPRSIADQIGHHPQVLRHLFRLEIPPILAEAASHILKDRVKVRRLWAMVNVALQRFLLRRRACPAEKHLQAVCDRWKKPSAVFDFIMSVAPKGTRVPSLAASPWTARHPTALTPRSQASHQAAPLQPIRQIPPGTPVGVKRFREEVGETWAELEQGGWVPTAPRPGVVRIKHSRQSVHLTAGGEGVSSEVCWERPAFGQGCWIDQRPQWELAPGPTEPVHIWRQRHDWRVTIDQGDIWWFALDVTRGPSNVLLRVEQGGRGTSGDQMDGLHLRSRLSAEFAIALWASNARDFACRQKSIVLGSADAAGHGCYGSGSSGFPV
eukprot:gene17899-biopygen5594